MDIFATFPRMASPETIQISNKRLLSLLIICCVVFRACAIIFHLQKKVKIRRHFQMKTLEVQKIICCNPAYNICCDLEIPELDHLNLHHRNRKLETRLSLWRGIFPNPCLSSYNMMYGLCNLLQLDGCYHDFTNGTVVSRISKLGVLRIPFSTN